MKMRITKRQAEIVLKLDCGYKHGLFVDIPTCDENSINAFKALVVQGIIEVEYISIIHDFDTMRIKPREIDLRTKNYCEKLLKK